MADSDGIVLHGMQKGTVTIWVECSPRGNRNGEPISHRVIAVEDG
jgi:hypothetical protein